MTKLSEKLANASVEDAPKLLEELREDMWQYHRDPDGVAFDKFNALIAIGPEGWLSAVMMLVPEGWAVEMFIAASREYSRAYLSRYSNDKLYRKRARSNTDPALALAIAIAQTMENDDD